MFQEHAIVQAALSQKNQTLAKFWFADPATRSRTESTLLGRKVLVVDAEDTFTEMLAQLLTALGLIVTLRKVHAPGLLEGQWDLVVMGPGPGDPRNRDDEKIAGIHTALTTLIITQQPFLAICLSHQVLSQTLGLNLIRKTSPNQGVQREIDFFGATELVGFYNTYVAEYAPEKVESLQKNGIEICWDVQTNDIHSLRGPRFSSVQFHPESLLTRNGIGIIASTLKYIMNS